MELIHWDDLRQDHIQLRRESDVLQAVDLGDPAAVWPILQQVCDWLSAGLARHIRREESFMLLRRRSLGAGASDAVNLPGYHYNDYRYMQVITRAVTAQHRPFLLNSRYQILVDFLSGLYRHLDEQEAEMFPDNDTSLSLSTPDTRDGFPRHKKAMTSLK